MGCTQSKIENEEAVTRCKQRKLFMKEAVAARNAFAAAHSAYAMSLKNTGAALSDYSHGEVQNSHVAAATPLPSSDAAVAAAAAAAQPPFDPLLPPPPPPSLTTFPVPIQRAASMPEMKIPKTRELGNGVAPTIVEENDFDVEEEEEELERDEKLVMRKRSSGRNKSGDHQKDAPALERAPPPAVVNSGSVQAVQDWDYWFPPVDSIPGTSLEVKVEEKETVESKVLDEIQKREEYVEEKPKEVPPTPPLMVEDVVDEKVVVAAASVGGSVGRIVKRGKSAAGTGEKRGVKGSLNLLRVFVELDDHFLKTSESAHEVSKMLEATRLHYHSNFADNRGNCLV